MKLLVTNFVLCTQSKDVPLITAFDGPFSHACYFKKVHSVLFPMRHYSKDVFQTAQTVHSMSKALRLIYTSA